MMKKTSFTLWLPEMKVDNCERNIVKSSVSTNCFLDLTVKNVHLRPIWSFGDQKQSEAKF